MKNIIIKDKIRNHILNMSAYSSARMEFDGTNVIFIDANENPYGSVSDYQCNRYPDPMQFALKQKIAAIEEVSTKQLFLGNGSDECIDILVRAFCEPKQDSILHFPPVFSMYQHCADINEVNIVDILLLKDSFQLDLDNILLEIQHNKSIKIIFICSPNNPTGNLIHSVDILKILNAFDGLVVIDEAYHDFSNEISWINELNNYNNLVVLKTFSKSWGMASARLGVLYANEEIIKYLNIIKMPYNVSQHTQEIALKAMDNIDLNKKYISNLILERDKLIIALQQMDCIKKIYPSNANYILVKVDDANKMYQYLVTNGIVVRNRTKSPLCENMLRFSIGTETENQLLLSCLKNYY